MAALAGIGIGAAVGGLSGALIGMGTPALEARRYEGRIRNGGILLSVHCDDAEWTKRAKSILNTTGAHDIANIEEAGRDLAANDQFRLRSC